MTKLESRKAFVIIIGTLLLSIVILGGALILFLPKENKASTRLTTCPNFINDKVVVGSSIKENEVFLPLLCKTNFKIKKVTEQYYDYNDDLIIKMKVLSSKQDGYYDLKDHYVGSKNSDLESLLNSGDTYTYRYTKNNDKLVLSKIELE